MRTRLTVLVLAVLSGVPSSRLPAQQRDFVLRQVKVPHNYYWREMYVPQVTGGPESATWSPDGTELIYAMQGSLWRQRIGTTEGVCAPCRLAARSFVGREESFAASG